MTLTVTQIKAGLLGIAMVALSAYLMNVYGRVQAKTKKTVDVTGDLEDALETMGNTGTAALEGVGGAAEDSAKKIRELQEEIDEENKSFNEQLADIVDARTKEIKENKKALEQAKESMQEELDTQKKTYEERVKEIENMNQTELDETGKTKEQLLTDAEETYKKETDSIKEEYTERISELEKMIADDEKLLLDHAELIKTINRDAIDDEITKLVEAHNKKIQLLNEEITAQKTGYAEGAASFDTATNDMAIDWDKLGAAIEANQIDWDASLNTVSFAMIVEQIRNDILITADSIGIAFKVLGAGFMVLAATFAIELTKILESAVDCVPFLDKLFDASLQKQLKLNEAVKEFWIGQGEVYMEELNTVKTKSEEKHKQFGGFAHGLTIVGEAGPELVSLPRGSRVYSSEQTKIMKGGGSVNVNFYGDLRLDTESRIDELVHRIEMAIGNNTNLGLRGI
jgi:hypothetical protein